MYWTCLFLNKDKYLLFLTKPFSFFIPCPLLYCKPLYAWRDVKTTFNILQDSEIFATKAFITPGYYCLSKVFQSDGLKGLKNKQQSVIFLPKRIFRNFTLNIELC